MSWHVLPTELHLAIVHLLPHPAVRALSSTSAPVRAICLPAIFANVTLPSAASLSAFVRHVPAHYGAYVRSLAICTMGATGALPADNLLALLRACPRLHALSLSLASSLDPEKAVPAFSRLLHLQSLEIAGWGTEDLAPVSERLVVALAASLPSLSHLAMSRITRSAMHVDPCDVPHGVPIVTNDFDVPPHPLLGTDLALPNLLRLPSLRTLEIRDTWLGCDTQIDLEQPASSSLEKLVLTGSMYATDTPFEAQACVAWLRACASLRSLELGTALASLPEPISTLPHVLHVHLNASRILPDDLSPTLHALKSCNVESISIAYEQERHMTSEDVPPKTPPWDDFARECALDDLQDWSAAVQNFLLSRSTQEWDALSRVEVSFTHDVRTSWVL